MEKTVKNLHDSAKEVMETITNTNIDTYIDENLTTWLKHIGVTP